jgi:hypothetical protein
MRLIFHGQLRTLYGPEVVMCADTITEALEGFSRQQDNWPSNLPVDVVGFNTPELLKTYADEVHLMPAMQGGGGKWGQIIIGAIIVTVGIFMLPNPIGVSLIISGGLMMAQGVLQLFMKAPTVSKNQDPEASKYLNVNRNTTAVGTPMTLAWGRIDLAGHWLSLQSDSNNLSFGVFPANPT